MQSIALSKAERLLLRVFREYLVQQGQMLCFFGPQLDKHRDAIRALSDRGLLLKERFRGGYSLTSQGFTAMQGLDDA